MSKSVNDSLVGTRIREYEILEVIGKGGMGAVYRARHVILDEERAIKVIHSRFAGETELVDRFIREAKILARLRHPNLVQLHEFGTLGEDTFFMVLELIRGESVLQRIRRAGKIPIEESIKIIREAALGLNSAHQKGIIHRDLSPDNLLIVPEGGTEVTKVIDFGIAKPVLEKTAQQTMANMFIGKLEYCSPEQCGMLPEGEMIDHRSDIYSLATTFYYMLVGKLPFFSETAQGYLFKHVHEIPKPPSSHFPPKEFPEILDRIVLKALAKKREDRQSSMDEFIKELDAVNLSLGSTIIEPVIHFDVGAPLKTGDQFANRYVIEQKLGEGGMGVVYQANDKILNVAVALKILNSKILNEEKTIQRLKREVILARKVAHPNVCRIFDIGEYQGVHYVSMELLQGETLADKVKREGALPLEAGLTITQQILQALAEAHRLGIIHRDLKPQNIMVDSKLETRIMDFGISTSSELQRLTQTNAFVGTPRYMAPEQIRGENVDHRADIYSIGVIIFEIFTGKLPFKAVTLMEIIYAQLKSAPIKPSTIVQNISPELERIILKCLEKEPDKRYSNVRELLQDVQRFAQANLTSSIERLEELLKKDPKNPEWNRLLENAILQKARQGLMQAHQFIRKGNFQEASEALQRVRQSNLKDPRILRQIEKLNSTFEKRKKQRELQDVRSKLDAALRPISAYDLETPAALIDQFLPEITDGSMQGKIRSIRDAISRIGEHLKSEHYPEAAGTIDELLSHDTRKLLKLQTSSFRKVQEFAREKEAHRIKFETALQKAREAYEESRWEDAIQFWNDAQRLNPEDVSIQSWIASAQERFNTDRQMRARVIAEMEKVEQLIAERNFEEANNLLTEIQQWISEYRFGHFQTQVEDLRKLWQEELKKENVRHRRNQDQLTQTIQLRVRGDLQDALQKVESLIQQEPDLQEALRLRDELHREMMDRQKNVQKFEATVSRGRDLYDQLQWEEAIRTWQEALQLKPDDVETKDWIAAAEERLKEEQEIRSELARNLADCEKQISGKNFDRARKILEASKEKLNTAFRIGDFQQQSAVLEDRLNREIEKERERQAAFHEDLDRAEELMKREEHRSAKVLIETVLQRDSKMKRALDLLPVVQKKIADQELRDSGTRPIQLAPEMPGTGTPVVPRGRSSWRVWAIPAIAIVIVAGIAIWKSIPDEPVPGPGPHNVSHDAEILSKAAALNQSGKLEESFKLLQGYVDQNPQDPKGRELYERVKEKLLKQREAQRQQKIQTLLAAAKLQNDSGDFIKASKTLQQVLDVDPFNKSALDQLTVINREIAKGQNQALVQQEVESHLTQARQDLAKQRFTQARSQLNQVLQLDPQNSQAIKLLAEVQEKLKDQEARQDQTAKVKELIASARNLQNRGQYESAIAALKQVLQLDSENQEAKTLMSQIVKEIQIPRFGEISIICEPFCSVVIDGEELGSSPISRRKIQTGTHTVVVRKPGYEEKRQTVDVKENKPVDLNFTLRKLS
jgi:serine/threonine protein kinase